MTDRRRGDQDLSAEDRALLRELLAQWLNGTAAGRGFLAMLPEATAIDLLLELEAEGRCRFFTTGDLEGDDFRFGIEGLPGLGLGGDPGPGLPAAGNGGTLH